MKKLALLVLILIVSVVPVMGQDLPYCHMSMIDADWRGNLIVGYTYDIPVDGGSITQGFHVVDGVGNEIPIPGSVIPDAHLVGLAFGAGGIIYSTFNTSEGGYFASYNLATGESNVKLLNGIAGTIDQDGTQYWFYSGETVTVSDTQGLEPDFKLEGTAYMWVQRGPWDLSGLLFIPTGDYRLKVYFPDTAISNGLFSEGDLVWDYLNELSQPDELKNYSATWLKGFINEYDPSQSFGLALYINNEGYESLLFGPPNIWMNGPRTEYPQYMEDITALSDDSLFIIYANGSILREYLDNGLLAEEVINIPVPSDCKDFT